VAVRRREYDGWQTRDAKTVAADPPGLADVRFGGLAVFYGHDAKARGGNLGMKALRPAGR
jgi:hypothetical protein